MSLPTRHPALRLLAKTPTHSHYRPHALLAGLVAHYTFTSPSLLPRRLPTVLESGVLPAGEIHIVPDASGCIVGSFDGAELSLWLWGPSSQVVSVPDDLEDGPLRFFVEFLPHAEYRFLQMPLDTALDGRFPLHAVDRALDVRLREAFEKSGGSLPLFLDNLDAVFLSRLDANRQKGDFGLLFEVLRLLRESGGVSRVDDIARKTGYSARHLNRICREQAGMSVKLLSRIFRINTACVLMPYHESLTRLSHELGYHDQAHFIHDFKQICGVSPGAYRLEMSGFYNERWKQWTMNT